MIMPQPKPVTPSQQIEQAERAIDDLLSVSLIHSDTSETHRRLPEPVQVRSDETGVDLEINGNRPMQPATTTGAAVPPAEHHGLKVIQPLEPILPAKERFAKELAELSRQEVQAAQPQVQAKQPKQAPQAPLPVAAAMQTPPPTAPAAPTPVAQSAPVQQAPAPMPAPQPVAAAPVPAPVPAPIPVPAPVQAAPVVDDIGLPPAESLEAGDVAKARAAHAAQAATPAPAPAQAPAPAPAVATAPAPAPAPVAPAAAQKKPEAPKPKHEEAKHKAPETKPQAAPKHDGSESVGSEAEAEHNKPTEAEKEQAAMTGKLILPSAQKHEAEPEKPKLVKPKKLAPGEVFVDENGNVVIGE
jgi:hypothetical protein